MEQATPRYVCVHGHFYQPPRENPWLEALEVQDSAHPYHDWNERITAECYAPNSASRILDGEGRLMDIASNYAKMSFNFGPTVLSWMEHAFPAVYQSILDADRQSIARRSGHGAALAQVYNHIIMPLANTRDKRTQVIWGIKDFQSRFMRFPEGMWLAETAVDLETLDILAEQGIKFTILAPHQAAAFRIGEEQWNQTGGENAIDPTRPYLCRLASGRSITLFFYDGPISHALAFENLLSSGDALAQRLLGGFSDDRDWPQLVHIATDGETYGHHQKFGDMALARAIHFIEKNNLAQLTNYGEYLARYPPTCEAQIRERTSWSCAHGVERWNSDCGCNSGGKPQWNQQWRRPLRAALDWLRDQLAGSFDQKGREYFRNPWQARDAYIEVVLDREQADRFLDEQSSRALDEMERVTALKLLEMQRHALLMYTSCGWFFDELSGGETVQIIHYAGRSLQLGEGLLAEDVEKAFQERLGEAKCNYQESRDGSYIYEKYVLGTRVDLANVGIHYAFSSLYEEYGDVARIFCYRVEKSDYTRLEAEEAAMAMGRIAITSDVTRESAHFLVCVVRFGNHDFTGSISPETDPGRCTALREEMGAAFDKGLYSGLPQLMDKHLGHHHHSLIDLFTDERRKILNLIIDKNLEEIAQSYHTLFEKNRSLMAYLREAGMPVSRPFLILAQPALNSALIRVLTQDEIDVEAVHRVVEQIRDWKVQVERTDSEYIVRRHLESRMRAFVGRPADLALLAGVQRLLGLLREIPLDVVLWQIQNDYCELAKKVYPEFLSRAKAEDEGAGSWVDGFRLLGEMLNFNLEAVLPQ